MAKLRTGINFKEYLTVLILVKGARGNDMQHDAGVLILMETAIMKTITLNQDTFTFKSTDCLFFGHILRPKRQKIDSKEVKVIVQKEPPDNLKEF